MFHESITGSVPLPVSTEFMVKPTRLMKEDNYTESPWFKERAILILATGQSVSEAPNKESLNELAEKFGQQTIPQQARVVKSKPLINKHKIAKGEAEVDLHISSLSTDYGRLSRSEERRV